MAILLILKKIQKNATGMAESHTQKVGQVSRTFLY